MSIAAGVDTAYGKPCTFAWKGFNGWCIEHVRWDDRPRMAGIFHAMLVADVRTVAIEDVKGMVIGGKVLVPTLLKCKEAQTRVLERLELYGFKVTQVTPAAWRGKKGIDLLSEDGTRPRKTKDFKIAAMHRAMCEGASPKNDDQADAVCLALYGARLI